MMRRHTEGMKKRLALILPTALMMASAYAAPLKASVTKPAPGVVAPMAADPCLFGC